MTTKQIKDNAPDGAVYYMCSNCNKILYFKDGDIGLMLYNGGGWWVCANWKIREFLKPL